jgi:hypothetical protein
MNGNVAICEVGATTYVVLSKAEDHNTYGELTVTTERMTLYPRCRTNLCRYNRFKLCYYVFTLRRRKSSRWARLHN